MVNASVQVELSPGVQRLIEQGPAAFVLRAISKALDRENEYSVGVAVRERMSFPRTLPATMEGLRVQSGRLRRSLTRSRATIVGDAVISAIGSNVRYFGVHEFGFQGIQSVKGHTRKLPDRYFLTTGQTVTKADAARAGLLTRKGELRKGLGEKSPIRYVAVRAHLRKVDFPPRAMVRKTVQARMPLYQLAIAEELQKALA